MVLIVAADCLSCVEGSAGLGIVVEGLGLGEGGKQVRWIAESAAGGIGGCEVGNGQAGLGAEAMGAGQEAFLGIPVCTLGETHGCNSIRKWLL